MNNNDFTIAVPDIDKSKEIHPTDVMMYRDCPRAWWFGSSHGLNLQPVQIPKPLFFGRIAHEALKVFYDNSRDLEASLDFVQEELSRQKQKLIAVGESLWKYNEDLLRYVEELLPPMLKHYVLWSERLDDEIEILATEQLFRVKIPESFNEDGSVALWSDLYLAGRFDGFVQDINGEYYVLEFKTVNKLYGVGYYPRNLQAGAYVWAANQIVGKPIKGILYRFLRKAVPDDPKPLKTGGYSQAKSQKTSYHWFVDQLRQEAGSEEQFKQLCRENEQIIRHLSEQELVRNNEISNDFFKQLKVRKRPPQLRGAMQAIHHYGKEMIYDPQMFPSGGWRCGWCSYKTPCDLIEYGGDWQGVLETEFASRDYWENEDDD